MAKKSKGLSAVVRYATPAHVARIVDFADAQEAAQRGDCERAIVSFGSGAINLGKARRGPVADEPLDTWKEERDRAEEAYHRTLAVINKSCRCQARR